MKIKLLKKSMLLALLTICSYMIYSQCSNNFIELYRQGEVDSFAINYPGCTNIINDLYIEMKYIDNLKGLSVLRGRQKNISIVGFNRQDVFLDGLNNIDSIEYLSLATVISTRGLEKVSYIKQFFNNGGDKIDFSGMTGLKTVDLWIYNASNNPQMPDSSDLRLFPEVPDVDRLHLNGNIQLAGIGKIKNLNNLSIINNRVLQNLLELKDRNSMNSIGMWNVWTDFSFIGTENIASLNGVIIRSVKNLITLEGLKNIKSLGYLYLENIPTFGPADLSQLESIEEINALYLIDVRTLRSLEGFPPSSVLHELNLVKNPVLSDITALEHVKSVDYKTKIVNTAKGVVITENSLLSPCNVYPVCEMLRTYPDDVKKVEKNASGCSSITDILSQCNTGITENKEDHGPFKIYPNPASDAITIENGAPIQSIEIWSAEGKLEHKTCYNETSNIMLDISHLAAGMKILKVENNQGDTYHYKIIKIE